MDLVSIPSPSGKEKDVAYAIKKRLNSYGIKSTFDNSGKITGSNTGNLIAKLQGKNSKKSLLFVAHMDTVETGEKKIHPLIKNGNITSDGTTILGADDKGAVAALIEALGEIQSLDRYPTIYGIFSTHEEAGRMGISCTEKIEGIDYSFNLDGQGPQGTFVYKSLGQRVFHIQIHGEASHSAIAPEKGKNAIAAASHFISHTRQGRKKNALVNFGTIVGGKEVNVVSDEVVVTGEIRGYSTKILESEYKKIEKQLATSCGSFGCKYDIHIMKDASVPVMEPSATKEMIAIAKKVSQDLGLSFKLEAGSFTTEANFLSDMGYKVLTVCRGGTNAHSKKESTTEKELGTYKNLIVGLAKLTRP